MAMTPEIKAILRQAQGNYSDADLKSWNSFFDKTEMKEFKQYMPTAVLDEMSEVQKSGKVTKASSGKGVGQPRKKNTPHPKWGQEPKAREAGDFTKRRYQDLQVEQFGQKYKETGKMSLEGDFEDLAKRYPTYSDPDSFNAARKGTQSKFDFMSRNSDPNFKVHGTLKKTSYIVGIHKQRMSASRQALDMKQGSTSYTEDIRSQGKGPVGPSQLSMFSDTQQNPLQAFQEAQRKGGDVAKNISQSDLGTNTFKYNVEGPTGMPLKEMNKRMSDFGKVKERGAFGKMMDSVSSKAKGLFKRKEISATERERSMLGRLKEGRASNKKIDKFGSKSSNMEGFKRLHSGLSLDPKDVGQAFDRAKGFVKEKLGRKRSPTSIANMSDFGPGLSSNTAMYPNIEGAKEMGPGLFGEGPKVMYPEVKGGKSKGSSLFGEKSTKMNEIRVGRNPLGATSVDDMFSSKIERGAYRMLDPERRADAVQGVGKLLGKGNELLRGASGKLSQQGVLGQMASAAMAPLEIATNIGSKVMGSDWMYRNIHNNASRSRMSDTKMIGSASRGLKNVAGFSKKAGMGAAGILGKAAKMGARNPLAVGAAALIAGVAGSALGDLENTSVGPREASGLQKLGGPVGLAAMAYMSSRDQTSNMKGADLAKSMSQPNKPDGPMSFGGGGSSMGGGRNYNMGATGDMALSLNSLRRGR